MADTEHNHFFLPEIQDQKDGWGPSLTYVPPQFTEVPYTPFSKADKLGKAADWNAQNQQYFQRGRQQPQAPVNTVFNYYHVEDDENFTSVEKKAQPKQKNYYQRGNRYGQRQGGYQRQGYQQRGGSHRGGLQKKRGGYARATTQKTRGNPKYQQGKSDPLKSKKEPSIEVKPDWNHIQDFEFSSLSKLAAGEPAPEDLIICGEVEYYNFDYDTVSTKTAKPLERLDRTFFQVSTSDDPNIKKFAEEGAANVFATDSILAALMTAPRSIYSWDIIVTKQRNKIFFDKRDNSVLDYVNVNESSGEPDGEGINSAAELSREATFINQNYSQQALQRGGETYAFEDPNPFAEPEDEGHLASVAYRYRRWKVNDTTSIIARCEVDTLLPNDDPDARLEFMTVRALNEIDPKGSSNAVDYRAKLDGQRGAVMALELRNNSVKLARWTAQSILAGSSLLKFGFVSRVQTKDNASHVILGSETFRPREFAPQINLTVFNMWGILKYFINFFLASSVQDGKYVLLKDPARNTLHLYELPAEAEKGGDDQ